MSLEKLYKENINRKMQEIKDMPTDFILKTNINNLSKKYKRLILLIIVILFFVLIITFLDSIRAMLSSFLLFIALTIFSVFFNSYSIVGKDGIITIKTNGEEIKISNNKIKNIYLEENTYRIAFKKRKSYSLVILYETPNNNICDIVLNTVLLSPKKLENWFSNITLKEIEANNQEKCIKYKRKRLLKKIIFYSVMLIITFIIIIVQHMS